MRPWRQSFQSYLPGRNWSKRNGRMALPRVERRRPPRQPGKIGRNSGEFAEMLLRRSARKQLHIGIHHDANQFAESHLWFPIEYFLRFRRATDQEIHFRRALITCVVFNKFFPIKIDM